MKDLTEEERVEEDLTEEERVEEEIVQETTTTTVQEVVPAPTTAILRLPLFLQQYL